MVNFNRGGNSRAVSNATLTFDENPVHPPNPYDTDEEGELEYPVRQGDGMCRGGRFGGDIWADGDDGDEDGSCYEDIDPTYDGVEGSQARIFPDVDPTSTRVEQDYKLYDPKQPPDEGPILYEECSDLDDGQHEGIPSDTQSNVNRGIGAAFPEYGSLYRDSEDADAPLLPHEKEGMSVEGYEEFLRIKRTIPPLRINRKPVPTTYNAQSASSSGQSSLTENFPIRTSSKQSAEIHKAPVARGNSSETIEPPSPFEDLIKSIDETLEKGYVPYEALMSQQAGFGPDFKQTKQSVRPFDQMSKGGITRQPEYPQASTATSSPKFAPRYPMDPPTRVPSPKAVMDMAASLRDPRTSFSTSRRQQGKQGPVGIQSSLPMSGPAVLPKSRSDSSRGMKLPGRENTHPAGKSADRPTDLQGPASTPIQHQARQSDNSSANLSPATFTDDHEFDPDNETPFQLEFRKQRALQLYMHSRSITGRDSEELDKAYYDFLKFWPSYNETKCKEMRIKLQQKKTAKDRKDAQKHLGVGGLETVIEHVNLSDGRYPLNGKDVEGKPKVPGGWI
ncbi:hypothetical protein ABW19_dt0201208 [Dactylella cylindrospora]|nr:hypothetical protein ABW19_dt0201208 [Dactylella cylindrospora]